MSKTTENQPLCATINVTREIARLLQAYRNGDISAGDQITARAYRIDTDPEYEFVANDITSIYYPAFFQPQTIYDLLPLITLCPNIKEIHFAVYDNCQEHLTQILQQIPQFTKIRLLFDFPLLQLSPYPQNHNPEIIQDILEVVRNSGHNITSIEVDTGDRQDSQALSLLGLPPSIVTNIIVDNLAAMTQLKKIIMKGKYCENLEDANLLSKFDELPNLETLQIQTNSIAHFKSILKTLVKSTIEVLPYYEQSSDPYRNIWIDKMLSSYNPHQAKAVRKFWQEATKNDNTTASDSSDQIKEIIFAQNSALEPKILTTKTIMLIFKHLHALDKLFAPEDTQRPLTIENLAHLLPDLIQSIPIDQSEIRMIISSYLDTKDIATMFLTRKIPDNEPQPAVESNQNIDQLLDFSSIVIGEDNNLLF